MMTPKPTIEDDGVQHYKQDRDTYVYVPDKGVFRLSKSATGYTATFWPGPPGSGMFAEVIASGATLRSAVAGAMGGGSRSPGTQVSKKWLDSFAQRAEAWL